MAKKKKNKIDHLKVLANTFYSTGFLTIIFASFWWSELKEDDKIKIKVSDTSILNIETYESLISNVLEDVNIDNKITKIAQVIEGHPYVKAARVSKHYPSEIRIEIMEREPIAIVNMDPMFLLDESGFVLPNLGNLNNHDLPIMSNFNEDKELYPYGSKAISVKVIECISLLSKLKNQYEGLYNNLSEIKMSSDNEIEMILADQPTQIFIGDRNINYRINVLKEFEKELEPKTISGFSYIDIRYDNQVIAKRRHS